MGANPHANGGLLLQDLRLPDFRDFARRRAAPGRRARRGDARRWAATCATCFELNAQARNFRLFGPDETASNRLDAVFEVTDRAWLAQRDARTTCTCRRTAA